MICKKISDSEIPEVAELLSNAIADQFTEESLRSHRTAKKLINQNTYLFRQNSSWE
ncbi:hypothetical protein AB4027_03565 [Alkalibacterium putridalgicola]|uniref:Uncharacterized protein n=1 Tax=Alkalibacterium putridalgicola TaxID=426703 RepID=A0ABQ0UXX6_9LACT|nr:hypothetical protein [Alkalibacterium putridalgicola]GEK89386.1 hypothetical protein APU01nite_14250 [Alkalibacterium putridalgicola]